MKTISIDPGLGGGLVFLHGETPVEGIAMPVYKRDGKSHYDGMEIRAWISERNPSLVIVEQAQAMPAYRGRCFKCKVDTQPITRLHLLAHDLKADARDRLEKIQVCPRCLGGESPLQGAVGTFNTGLGFGFLLGILVGLGYSDQADATKRYTTISPQSWTTIFRQCHTPGQGKERSANLCRQLWPTFNTRATARSVKPHSGITDAAVLGYVALGRERSVLARLADEEVAF